MEGKERETEINRHSTPGIGVCPGCNSVIYNFQRRVVDYMSAKAIKEVYWHLSCWVVAAERTAKKERREFIANGTDCVFPKEEDQPNFPTFSLHAK